MSGPRAAAARMAAVFAVVTGADQALKAIVTSSVGRGERSDVFFGIDIVNVRNRGVAFGVLEHGGAIVVVVIVIAVAALLTYFVLNATRPWAWLATGLLLGGAAGNAIDRIAEGAVIDFLKLPAWPAFNLADSAITIGVAVLLLVIERGDGAQRRA